MFLTGSYVLDFDTNAKMASTLLKIWLDGKDPSFMTTRNQAIERITLADVKRVAQLILRPDRLILTVVGRPNL